MGSTTTPISILHVDDDPEFAEMAAAFLEREDGGFVLETATDVSEALDYLSENEVDCIVSDYEMPNQNGIDILITVRERYDDLPFILYTGEGSEEIASRAVSAGVTDYFRKEPDTGQYAVLANRIRNAVKRYRAQRELEASQKRLSLFIEQSPLGVMEFDDDFTIVSLNEAAEEILGYPEHELRGKSWERIVADTSYENVDDVTSALLEDEGGYHSINENVRKDGEKILCEWHNRVVTDEEGTVVAIFSVFQDITDRKEREERLKKSNARLEALFENSPDMINIHTIDGTIVDVNQKFCDVFAQPEEELIGRKVWEIDQDLDPQSLRENLNGMDIGDQLEVETEFEREDGVKFPAEVRVSRLPIDDGERFMVITRDITERKAFEEQLKEQRDNLKILNQVLRHDIRNDLQIVTAYADMLADNVTAENREYVDTVKENAKHAIELTTTARDMADVWLSVENGLYPVSLKSTLENELDEIRGAQTDSAITIDGDIPDVTVRADDMLNSVFHNILQNAIRHSDSDIPEVEISVEEGEDTVLVRVADNGPGVPDDQKETIFGKGEKGLDSSGTGLGLYLVKTLVENYEGDVWVEDNEPGGAVFVVELHVTTAER